MMRSSQSQPKRACRLWCWLRMRQHSEAPTTIGPIKRVRFTTSRISIGVESLRVDVSFITAVCGALAIVEAPPSISVVDGSDQSGGMMLSLPTLRDGSGAGMPQSRITRPLTTPFSQRKEQGATLKPSQIHEIGASVFAR